MTTDIKELVKRLREEADHQHDLAHDCDCAPEATANWAAMLDIRSAADALEAMAGEVAELNQHARILRAAEATQANRAEAAEAERDRLKAALDWALGEGDEWPERKPGEGAFYWRAELRRKALGGDAS